MAQTPPAVAALPNAVVIEAGGLVDGLMIGGRSRYPLNQATAELARPAQMVANGAVVMLPTPHVMLAIHFGKTGAARLLAPCTSAYAPWTRPGAATKPPELCATTESIASTCHAENLTQLVAGGAPAAVEAARRFMLRIEGKGEVLFRRGGEAQLAADLLALTMAAARAGGCTGAFDVRVAYAIPGCKAQVGTHFGLDPKLPPGAREVRRALARALLAALEDSGARGGVSLHYRSGVNKMPRGVVLHSASMSAHEVLEAQMRVRAIRDGAGRRRKLAAAVGDLCALLAI